MLAVVAVAVVADSPTDRLEKMLSGRVVVAVVAVLVVALAALAAWGASVAALVDQGFRGH